MKKVFTLLFIIGVVLQSQAQTVWDVIVNSPDHNTLETAVLQAGLDGPLSTEASLTVFAPTDAAFDALPSGALAALLADNDALTDVLLYHVAAGTVLSGDLSDGQMITTLQGQDVTVSISGGVMINNAMVTTADVVATNGVVHVIDAVLLPPAIVNQTITDIVNASPDHTTLAAALNVSGLDGALSAAGTYTLFAPTDAAFDALPAGVLDGLLNDPSGALTDVLLYHALGSVVMSTDLMDGMMAMTLQGQDITVTIDNGSVFINNAMVTLADIPATNGVVHVIDAVLVPSMPTNSIYDYVSNSADHTTLLAAIDAAGLGETLSGGSYTLFAPTNAAFDALPAGTLDALLADPSGFLTEILFYHVLDGVVLSSDLSDGMMATTLQGQDITVTISNGMVFINDAMVTVADVMVDNGVIHVIDAVLIPQEITTTTVFDIIQNSADHNTLEAAIVAAGLDADLSTAGPFTVFAPTDAAFAALPAGVIDALLADPAGELTDILLYHVVGGTVLSGDLQEGMVMTLNGLSVNISFSGSDIFVNDAMVTIADLTADNGVVHVIDAVLIPTEPNPATVADIIMNSEDHNTLEAALNAASLMDALMGDGPFTVFAPTDAAFAALPAGVIDALLADPAGELTDILLYHVVGDTYMSTDLSDGQVLATLSTPYNLEITIDGGNVIINNSAMVTVADLVADNGVVHVIDAVLLLPASVAEVSELGLEIYPNPAENMLNINLKNSSSKVIYQIIDMTGGLIEQNNLTAVSNQINVDNLAAGIYTIRVIDGNNVSVSNFIKK